MEKANLQTRPIEGLAYQAGALSLAAGVVHGVATAEYWTWWWGYAAFFLYAAIAQVVYGLVVLVQPWRYDETGGVRKKGHGYARPIFLIGAIGNLAIIGLYIVTRTVGVPFVGPAAGTVLPVTPLSVLSKTIETILVAILLVLLARTRSPAA